MTDFPQLNLPPFDCRMVQNAGINQIWDNQRQRFVVITPEEWVRQHFINYVIHVLNYPAGLVSVEKEVQVLRKKKRFDIVIYSKNLKPWMIVECKSYNVGLSQDTIDQAGRYNIALKAPFLVITNGMSYLIARINFETAEFKFQQEFPDFPID